MRRHAYKGHLLAHKSPKRKRFLSTESQVNHADIANVMVCARRSKTRSALAGTNVHQRCRFVPPQDCLPYARIKH